MEDKDLIIIEKIKKGDKDAFSELVLKYEKKVYNFAYQMSKSHEDAMDISQEAFVKAYKSLNNFKGEAMFSTYLYKIVNSTAIDFLKKRDKIKTFSLTDDNDEQSFEFEIKDDSYNPEKIFEKKDTIESLQQALDTLSPEYKQILILRELNGLSYTEIADVLSLKEGTVKSRILRARGKMIEFLSKSGNFFDKNKSKK